MSYLYYWSSSYAPVASVCNERKRELLNKLETKIEAGMEKLDHAHNIVVAEMKTVAICVW